MIHSLSGGVIKSSKNYNFIKVEDGLGGFIWLACDGFSAMVGDIAVYENKKGLICRGKVMRVDENVSGQTSPVPMNRISLALKIEKE